MQKFLPLEHFRLICTEYHELCEPLLGRYNKLQIEFYLGPDWLLNAS